MKIGFDLHGVLNTNPQEFQRLLLDLATEHRILVVSGPITNEIEAELTNLRYIPGLHYHEIKSVVDYLRNKNVKMWWDEKGTWWASDADWWSAKANICEENGIDVLVDDKRRYGTWFGNASSHFLAYDPTMLTHLKSFILNKTRRCL